MKKLLSLILALAMVLALVACGNKTTDDSNAAGNGDTTDADPIRIGFFAPVSAASAAADGQSAEQSAKLAVKLINEAGGINGRKVELVNYDDGLDTAEAANILEKLTTVDNVDAIVSGSYSGPTKVAAPICQDAGIVMVSAYAVHPDVVNAGDFIFSQSFPGAVQATAAAQFAVGELKANRIAIVAVDLDFGKEQAAYFKAQAAKLGAEILKREGYDQDIVDMVHYHHENYDGSGYPYRMRGEEIPLGARLIRVCDVFSALVSDRPYRKAFDADTAFGMVIDEVRHFDMRAFLAFQRLINTTDIMSRVDQVLHGDIPGLDEK